MNKFFNGFFTLLVVGSLMILSSCSSDEDALAKKVTIDGEKITLANGYIAGFGVYQDDNGDPVSEYGVILSSSGLTMNDGDFSGTGTFVFMQLVSTSSIQLANGTYTIADLESESYLKGDAFSVTLKDYNSTTDDAEVIYYATSGTIKITKSGSTYKITFNFTLSEDGVNEIEAKGSFEGKLEETSFGS